MHAFFPDRNNLRILWGPKRLHQLSGAVTTPIFRHFGLSSWHAIDGRVFTSVLPLFVFIVALIITLVVFAVVGWVRYKDRAGRIFLARKDNC